MFPAGGITTDLPQEISWNNLFGGFAGKHVLGPILPTGMTLNQLALLLDNADYTGQLGTGPQVFDLAIKPVPEPTSIVLLCVAGISVSMFARRQRRYA